MRLLVVALSLGLWVPNAAAQDFNNYILRSVDELVKNHSGGGYDINKAYTQNIPYGDAGFIKASAPPLTMCVAAAVETIVNAINIYTKSTGDMSPYSKIPLKAWTSGNLTSLKANIFMFAGTGSRGTGHTLAQYGIGEELRFQDLKPGDFINFNRMSKSGHAVIFLGYLNSKLSIEPSYNGNVVGFRYFSAQGKGRPDAGFAYRNAFFEGFCPDSPSIPRDCRIIRSTNRAMLNAGRMWSPERWGYSQAVDRKVLDVRRSIEDDNEGADTRAIGDLLNDEISKELEWSADQSRAFDSDDS